MLALSIRRRIRVEMNTAVCSPGLSRLNSPQIDDRGQRRGSFHNSTFQERRSRETVAQGRGLSSNAGFSLPVVQIRPRNSAVKVDAAPQISAVVAATGGAAVGHVTTSHSSITTTTTHNHINFCTFSIQPLKQEAARVLYELYSRDKILPVFFFFSSTYRHPEHGYGIAPRWDMLQRHVHIHSDDTANPPILTSSTIVRSLSNFLPLHQNTNTPPLMLCTGPGGGGTAGWPVASAHSFPRVFPPASRSSSSSIHIFRIIIYRYLTRCTDAYTRTCST
jgi:hypothetical protein